MMYLVCVKINAVIREKIQINLFLINLSSLSNIDFNRSITLDKFIIIVFT